MSGDESDRDKMRGHLESFFENDPAGAWFTFMNWGTREDVYVSRYTAAGIMSAIMRDPDSLGGEES